MVESHKRPKLVGSFIREKREALGLSQRSLGLLFNPVVTTQFISNVERGVTPLPPIHVNTLCKALQISESDLTILLEKEYVLKLSGRLGRGEGENGGIASEGEEYSGSVSLLSVSQSDYDFIKDLYAAYQKADHQVRQSFATLCSNILGFSKKPNGNPAENRNNSSGQS